MASLECRNDQLANSPLPYCMYGVGHCLDGRENRFQQSKRLAGHVDE